MVGMGTRDSRVARLLGGTDRSKMAAVAACYLDVHGKSLDEALKGDLSGTFLKVGVICAGCWLASLVDLPRLKRRACGVLSVFSV